MPVSTLWATTTQGFVYKLSTHSSQWKPLHSSSESSLTFKRLAAIHDWAWAIGSDHHIYIYIPIRDIPIRCKEITFENQRWNPMEGFSSRLLPTDRAQYSSEDGTESCPKDEITLPSAAWHWETPWYIEDNLEGQPLEPEGWTYAFDFPSVFGPTKHWNSMVRRRKWVRYRRFTAMDSWSPIPGLDPAKEPFIDVAIGGTEIPGGDPNTYSVWAVTILGNVLFRSGVTVFCPEGECWTHVSVPSGSEVNQISVGPAGHVWATCWDGSALVRLGVDRSNSIGTCWEKVDSPNEDAHLIQIAVGTNVVWAVSKDGKVWFRKGVQGHGMNTTGSGWVEMYGDMAMLSIAPFDQVFALSKNGETIYIRNGVTPQELTGKTWKPISLSSRTQSHKSSRSSFSSQSLDDPFISGSLPKLDPKSSLSSSLPMVNSLSLDEQMTTINLLKKSHKSANISSSPPKISQIPLKAHSEDSLPPSSIQNPSVENLKHSNRSNKTVSRHSSHSSQASDTVIDFVSPLVGESEQDEDPFSEEPEKERLTPECPCATNHHTYGDMLESGQRTGSIFQYKQDTELVPYQPDLPNEVWPASMDEESIQHKKVWAWVAAGSCFVEPFPSRWFSSSSIFSNDVEGAIPAKDEKWRKLILQRFKDRFDSQVKPCLSFPQAIEKGCWVKSVNCRWWAGKRTKWQDCTLELETLDTTSGTKGTLMLLPFSSHFKKMIFDLSELECVLRINENAQRLLLIFATGQKKPLKVNFTADASLLDWLATLNVSCLNQRSLHPAVEPNSVYVTTLMGDVYISPFLKNNSRRFWYLLGGGHMYQVATCTAGVMWGLGYNNTPWVYSGGYGGGPFKGIPGHNVEVHVVRDTRCVYVYENQRWNPLTGFAARGLPTDRYMWSDRTGREERTKSDAQLPSIHWTWVSEWEIDYKIPGGTDNEGWQYAADFPLTYHSSKHFTDYVRRRRWYRKCRLITQGPWLELGSTPLISISLYSTDQNRVHAWGVSTNGDVLCRLDVSSDSPEGSCWIHVPTELCCKSIAVGGQVWAVATDGSAFLRQGISCHNPTGMVWFHVEPPPGCPLKNISVGKTSVYALGENQSLWFRQEIMPTFPEGTYWKFVADNVYTAAVSPEDELWAICDVAASSSHKAFTRALCRRKGITKEDKIGDEWEVHLTGSCWNYLGLS